MSCDLTKYYYTHAPNVDAALWLGKEILPQLRHFRSSARLELAGAYPPTSVRQLEGSHLRVLGRVADVEELMRRAAVVFAPVRTGGGMRMKTLHAMALGKAVLTTPLGIEGLTVGGRIPAPPRFVWADRPESRPTKGPGGRRSASRQRRRSRGHGVRVRVDDARSPGLRPRGRRNAVVCSWFVSVARQRQRRWGKRAAGRRSVRTPRCPICALL